MFQFKRDFENEYCGARDLAISRSLNPRAADLRRSGSRRTPARIPLV